MEISSPSSTLLRVCKHDTMTWGRLTFVQLALACPPHHPIEIGMACKTWEYYLISEAIYWTNASGPNLGSWMDGPRVMLEGLGLMPSVGNKSS